MPPPDAFPSLSGKQAEPPAAAVILFDFDGTLADSFPAVMRVATRLAKEENRAMPGEEEIPQLRRLHAGELLKRSGISKAKLPFWLNRLRRELALETPGMSSFPGMREALTGLRAKGTRMGIITSNGEAGVRLFLEKHDWTNLFCLIETGSPLFGKARLIRRAARHLKSEPGAIWYAGDELRDIEAARQAGVCSAAVTWGFNDAEVLAAAAPDALLHHPGDLRMLSSQTAG